MSEAQPPPPDPPPGLLMKRGKMLWRVLLISNFVLGAYLFSRPKKKEGTEVHTRKDHKLQKEKKEGTEVPEPQPSTTTTSMDSIFDDDSLYFPVSIPEGVRAPITNEQQREVFKWMLEEKRKLKPKDPAEKKQIDEEKALLKQILRSDTTPKF